MLACVYIIILPIVDTAYFIFGENMRIFISDDPTHKEFIEAALDFIKEIFQIRPIPIYKYFSKNCIQKLHPSNH